MAHSFDQTEYCRTIAARDDPDRYLASLFAPATVRGDIWAILAFNQDIARVRDTVRDPALGLMRLQWWRDALVEGRGYKGHPIAEALHATIAKYDLPVALFGQLIDGREIDVAGPWPDNLAGLEHYADFTSTPLCALTARLCGAPPDAQCRDLGVAYALTGLIRAMPHDPDRAGDVRHMAQVAQAHLGRVANVRMVRPLRAMRALTKIYLNQIEGAGYDVYASALSRPPMFKELRVWLTS